MTARPAVFILNPVARRAPSLARLRAAIDRAAGPALQPEIRITERPAHAIELAREAEAGGAGLIFACGGDGTINEVLNGLRNPSTQVGVIPAGTADVWAAEAGIPGGFVRAIRAQLGAQPLRLDVGRAGERRFLLMAGLGLDAAAAAAVSPRLKRLTGRAAYIAAGARVGALYHGHRFALRFDDGPPRELRANMIVIGNTRLYGSAAAITSEASAVDGELDCVIFRGGGPIPALRGLSLMLLRRHLRSGAVLFERARSIRIEPLDDRPPLLQVDGDVVDTVGGFPSEFSIEPLAVTMLVPNADRPVFQLRR